MDMTLIPAEARKRLQAVLRHTAGGGRSSCVHAGSCGAAEPRDIEDLCPPESSAAFSFDPRLFAETQKPLLEASTLPGACYHRTPWHTRELERVFGPSWSCLGREDEIPEPGQYLAFDTEWSGPVAVCRGKDDRLHAFANVCRHRGAKVLQGNAGKASKVGLVCPYHAWTYDFDGSLKWAPGMEQVRDFDEAEVRLKPISLEVFHGFVFVSNHEDSPPLLETLGDLPEKMAPWFGPDGMARGMVTAGRREYSVPCNWKLLMENTCETYHTSIVHRGSLGPMKSTPAPPHVGNWDAVEVQTNRSVVPLPEDFQDEQFPLPAFADRTCFINLFPSLQINVTWDCMWWMRLVPVGVEETHIQMGFCFPRETTQLPKFPSVFEKYLARWHIAVSEDIAISLNQQRGLRSPLRVPGRFHPMEFGTHNFNNWLLAQMVDSGPRWDPGARVFTGDASSEWTNDDERLLAVVGEGLKA